MDDQSEKKEEVEVEYFDSISAGILVECDQLEEDQNDHEAGAKNKVEW